jgi:hypothetical protein
VIECPEFRQLIQLLRRDIKESDIFHCTKLRDLILDASYRYFQVLKRDLAVSICLLLILQVSYVLQNALGKVSFTSDLWSNTIGGYDPYMAITAHWIAQEGPMAILVLKAGLIAFHYLHGAHTGKELASTMVYLLDRAEVTNNVSVRLYHKACSDLV